MKAPLSWLREYVAIKIDPKILGDKLIEIGLGTEKIYKEGGETIFDLEITPNRPDLLSILGVAREISAIEKAPLKLPKIKSDLLNLKIKKPLLLKIETDTNINPRFTAIIIKNITVKESPKWLRDKLIQVGQRPINNIVDITNFVMLELGNPIHAFDYDKIVGSCMTIKQAKGGEVFESVDGITYSLPKGAVIIKDKDKIIDLCGIKGGKNTGTYQETKNIILRAPVEIPTLIRKTSQALGLRSEASSIFERGVNKGGTVDAIRRCVDLVLELAGGDIASTLYDIKKDEFEPWSVSLRLERLSFILGITIPEEDVINILTRLNLNPKIMPNFCNPDKSKKSDYKKIRMGNLIECTIPTYRNDLQIEEDIIEEVARIYGYNNFPKTMPIGEIPTKKIPYFKDYKLDEEIKKIITSAGFSEIYTNSLISEDDILQNEEDPSQYLQINNPISKDFKYLRQSLKINLKKALIQNMPYAKHINLFELGKIYLGKNIKETSEKYYLAGISNIKSFYEAKGVIELLYRTLGINEDASTAISIIENGVYFQINITDMLDKVEKNKIFQPIPKFPPIIEDISIIISTNIKTGDIIESIKKQSHLVVKVSLLNIYKDTRTFHIIYQHPDKNITSEDVVVVRKKIINHLKEKFLASLK